jgi:hypothetical protein
MIRTDRSPARVSVHGESYGWTCEFIDDGRSVYSRRWTLRAEALAEADAKRREL